MSRQVQTNFRAEDFGGGAKSKKPARKRTAPKAKAEAAPVDPNAVPDGTTEEVLDWVGEDKDRAKRALEKERGGSQPRVTLVEPLEKVLEEPEEPEAGTEPGGDEAPEKAPAKKAPAKKSGESDK